MGERERSPDCCVRAVFGGSCGVRVLICKIVWVRIMYEFDACACAMWLCVVLLGQWAAYGSHIPWYWVLRRGLISFTSQGVTVCHHMTLACQIRDCRFWLVSRKHTYFYEGYSSVPFAYFCIHNVLSFRAYLTFSCLFETYLYWLLFVSLYFLRFMVLSWWMPKCH
jgi:hypothetical protein